MVCFLILHYLAYEETTICVDSIINNVKGKKKIVIVDNDSPNNSYQKLINRYEKEKIVDIIKTEKNLGFANGNNYGYQYCIENYNPEFIVVMNNDMEIKQDNFIDLIKKSFKEYNYSILGPDIYSTKKKYHQNPQSRKMPTLKELKKINRSLRIKKMFKFLIPLKWKIRNLVSKGKKDNITKNCKEYNNNVVINCMLHGSCYIFSPLFIKKHKKECFYNKTFMYYEAEILYYLSKKNNEKMIYYPDLHVNHHEDVSTDCAYDNYYKKSLFSMKCMIQSSEAFISLLEKNGESHEE